MERLNWSVSGSLIHLESLCRGTLPVESTLLGPIEPLPYAIALQSWCVCVFFSSEIQVASYS